MTKRCTQCGESKPPLAFNKHAKTLDGRQSHCRECSKKIASEWQRSNRERANLACKAWYDKNADVVRAKKLDYGNRRYLASPEKVKASVSRWQKENREKVNAWRAEREAKELTATPSWSIDFFVQEAYHWAKLRSELFSFPWHVPTTAFIASMVIGHTAAKRYPVFSFNDARRMALLARQKLTRTCRTDRSLPAGGETKPI